MILNTGEIIESAKYDGIFGFSHPACKAKNPINYKDDDSEVVGLTVKMLRGKNIKFAYRRQLGLVKSDSHTSEPQLPIKDLPISSDLNDFLHYVDAEPDYIKIRGIKNSGGINAKDVIELAKYIEKYGYFFNCSEFEKYKEVNPIPLFSLLDRLYIVTSLLSELRMPRKNYNKIFFFTFSLIFSEPVTLIDPETSETIYQAQEHPCYKRYKSANGGLKPLKRIYSADEIMQEQPWASIEFAVAPEFEEDNNDELFETDLDNMQEQFGDKRHEEYVQRIIREMETGECSDIRQALRNKFYVVKDYFMEETKESFLSLAEYEGVGDYIPGDETLEDIFFRDIKYLYVSCSDIPRQEKLVYDFLFHFIREIDGIKDINPMSLRTFTMANKKNLNKCLEFNQHYKDVLIEIASNAVKVELEPVVEKVKPQFDTKGLCPTWKVPDLFTAMYYSIFMSNGKLEIYRECGNPYCERLFPVVITNTKKKYCSDRCRAAVAQRMKRIRDMKQE